MRGPQLLIVVLLLAVVAMGGLLVARSRTSPETAGGGNLIAYGPCGLSGPLQNAVAAYRKAHPDAPVQIIYDNANILVRRVLQKGERPDVFISPGELELSQVSAKGLVDQSTVKDFGSLDLVLIVPAKNTTITRVEDLTSDKIAAVSLGDPAFNSVGFYGLQVMKARGVWDKVEPKMVLREGPLEAFNLVAGGQVQAGFSYLTCPLETNPEKASKSDVRIVEKFDRKTYGPIRLQAGMLKTSARRQAAEKFIAYLASPEAQQVMSKDGVLPVDVLANK